MNITVVRYIPRYREDDSKQLLSGLLQRARQLPLTLAVGLATIGSAVLFATGTATQSPRLLIATWMLPAAAALILHREILRADGRFGTAYGLAALLPPASALVVALGIVAAGLALSAAWMLGAVLVCMVGATFLMYAVVRQAVDCRGLSHRTHMTREWLRIATPLFIISCVTLVTAQADLVAVGMLVGGASVGHYAAANKTAALVAFGLNAISAVVAPRLARHYAAGDVDGFRRLLSASTQFTLGFGACVAFVLAIAARTVMAAFGAGFSNGAAILRVLLLAQLATAATGPVGSALAVADRHWLAAKIFVMAAVVDVVLLAALTPRLGAIGAAVSFAASMIVNNAALYWAVSREFDYQVWRPVRRLPSPVPVAERD